MAELLTEPDEEIVMTPLKPKDGRRIIRIERTTTERINSDRVHYAAGGRFEGIIVNKAVNVKPKKTPPHAVRHFIAHVNTKQEAGVVKEVREIRFWFKSNVSDEMRDVLAEDFFKDLMNPYNFPKDYISFVKRMLRLVQSYLSVRHIEIEMRPFTEEDGLLDVRGQRMFPPGASVTTRQSAFRPVSMFSTVPTQWTANGEGTQSPISNGAEQPTKTEASDAAAENNAVKKKKKKKTRSESDTYVTPSLTRTLNGLDLSSEDFIQSNGGSEYRSTATVLLAEKPERCETNIDGDSDIEIAELEEEPIRSTIAPHTGYLHSGGNPTHAALLSKSPDDEDDDDDNVLVEDLPEEPRQLSRVSANNDDHPLQKAALFGFIPVKDDEQSQPASTETDPAAVVMRHRRPNSSGSARASSRKKSGTSQDGGGTEKKLSKLEKITTALEDAFPNALTADDIANITRVKRATVETLLVEMSQSRTAVEFEPGMWLRDSPHRDVTSGIPAASTRKSKRASQLPSQDSDPRQHQFQFVAHVPSLVPRDQPTVAIVTSLYCEKLAVDAMIDYKMTFVRCKTGGDGQVYTVGRIGKHRVVSTKLPRVGTDAGSSLAAGNAITRLLGAFGRIEHVILVGVAGGVTFSDDELRDIRLGDVIVSLHDENNTIDRPVYVDMTSESADCWESMKSYSAPDGYLWAIYSKLSRTSKTFYKRFDQYINEGLTELESCVDMVDSSNAVQPPPISIFTRPSTDTDPVSQPIISGSARDRRGPDRSIVHTGSIGAGRALVRDPDIRQRAANELGVLAVDTGFPALLDSIVGNRKESFGVVRGVADYTDGTSKAYRQWRPYAALAAAATAKCIIMAIPAPYDEDEIDAAGAASRT